jgi:hypothetical protein
LDKVPKHWSHIFLWMLSRLRTMACLECLYRRVLLVSCGSGIECVIFFFLLRFSSGSFHLFVNKRRNYFFSLFKILVSTEMLPFFKTIFAVSCMFFCDCRYWNDIFFNVPSPAMHTTLVFRIPPPPSALAVDGSCRLRSRRARSSCCVVAAWASVLLSGRHLCCSGIFCNETCGCNII